MLYSSQCKELSFKQNGFFVGVYFNITKGLLPPFDFNWIDFKAIYDLIAIRRKSTYISSQLTFVNRHIRFFKNYLSKLNNFPLNFVRPAELSNDLAEKPLVTLSSAIESLDCKPSLIDTVQSIIKISMYAGTRLLRCMWVFPREKDSLSLVFPCYELSCDESNEAGSWNLTFFTVLYTNLGVT